MILDGVTLRLLKIKVIRNYQKREFSLLMIPLLQVIKDKTKQFGVQSLLFTTQMISLKLRS
jgi:hypothetical protein